KHVIVSYNGDLRGIVEDLLREQRDVRISVPSFHKIGALVEGTALLATVPTPVAAMAMRFHPRLRLARLPFRLASSPMELLWRSALDDDDSIRFVIGHVVEIAHAAFGR